MMFPSQPDSVSDDTLGRHHSLLPVPSVTQSMIAGQEIQVEYLFPYFLFQRWEGNIGKFSGPPYTICNFVMKCQLLCRFGEFLLDICPLDFNPEVCGDLI